MSERATGANGTTAFGASAASVPPGSACGSVTLASRAASGQTAAGAAFPISSSSTGSHVAVTACVCRLAASCADSLGATCDAADSRSGSGLAAIACGFPAPVACPRSTRGTGASACSCPGSSAGVGQALAASVFAVSALAASAGPGDAAAAAFSFDPSALPRPALAACGLAASAASLHATDTNADSSTCGLSAAPVPAVAACGSAALAMLTALGPSGSCGSASCAPSAPSVTWSGALSGTVGSMAGSCIQHTAVLKPQHIPSQSLIVGRSADNQHLKHPLGFLSEEHTQQGLYQMREWHAHLQGAILRMARTFWHRCCLCHPARRLSRIVPFVHRLNMPAQDSLRDVASFWREKAHMNHQKMKTYLRITQMQCKLHSSPYICTSTPPVWDILLG